MDKNFENFGGWLKFFYVLCLINIFTSIIVIFLLLGELNSESQSVFKIILDCCKAGVGAYILYQIVTVIKLPKPTVPEYIKDKLFYLFIISILYFLIFVIFTFPDNGWEWQMEHTIALITSIQTMVWSAIWRTYFEKSKRVEEYYSQNENSGQNLDTYK